MSRCTWVDCHAEATRPQTAKDGQVWANLCDEHEKALDAAVAAGPRQTIGAWVKAQGGAKAAASRMTGGKP